MTQAQDSVRAVDRALGILLAFGAQDRGLTVAELLKRVNLSRPTLYRLLRTLERSRFLSVSGDPQQFHLGPAVARLAHLWNAQLDLEALAQPVMQGIWEATGETVALFVPEGQFRVCVAELPSAQPLSFKRGVGYRDRLVLGASGRAILAHRGLDAAGLRAQAAGLKIDLKRYPRILAEAREQGYAVSESELIQGAVAVATPFFNSAGVAGSLGIFGPEVRLGPAQIERCGRLLVKEARALSRALGGA